VKSWDSAVGIATGYGLDGREVEVRVKNVKKNVKNFLLSAFPASYPLGAVGDSST
jgi:hypothetical protein